MKRHERVGLGWGVAILTVLSAVGLVWTMNMYQHQIVRHRHEKNWYRKVAYVQTIVNDDKSMNEEQVTLVYRDLQGQQQHTTANFNTNVWDHVNVGAALGIDLFKGTTSVYVDKADDNYVKYPFSAAGSFWDGGAEFLAVLSALVIAIIAGFLISDHWKKQYYHMGWRETRKRKRRPVVRTQTKWVHTPEGKIVEREVITEVVKHAEWHN